MLRILTSILLTLLAPGLAAQDCLPGRSGGYELYELRPRLLGPGSVGFCFETEHCFSFDWNSGRYAPWSGGAASPEEAAPVGTTGNTVEKVAGGLRLCEDGGKNCRTLPIRADEAWLGWEQLGPSLLLRYARCAGPCETGMLFDAKTGRFIAFAGGKEGYVIGTERTVLPVSPNLFVFAEAYGLALHFQDVRSGRVVHKIDLAEIYRRQGIENRGGYPNSTLLFEAGPNRMLVFFSAPHPGAALLVDRRQRRPLRFFKPVLCPRSGD